ncbi:zinc finger protein [Clarias magur]|uniref:Zinc finger protein n=1 Tax=Clarias magur TaxID=1594786 RepID=A0A8J4X4S6_CLAMG|nr:zinc finger protein [Clarias magur]
MEDLTAETPSNEKSCQTDGLDEKSPALRPAYFVEPGDPPLLQRPLQTSKSGIQQIIECLRTGTPQLKHMLLKEVDLIFECKLCQSLFRGLPNLITHKEFYCFPRLPETEDRSGTCRQKIVIKELLEVIHPRPTLDETVVRLEPIPSNQNAVFQHLTKPGAVDVQSSNHGTEDLEHDQPESQGQDMTENDISGERDDEQANEGDDEANTEKDPQGDEDQEEQEDAGEEKVLGVGTVEVTISCSLCGKDFSSRRSVRRHCREVHKQRLEELRKFTETRTVPISLLSVVKERPVNNTPAPNGKRCQVCFKTFATKANVRRHFDEVHRGLPHDVSTLEHISNKSSDPGDIPAVPCLLRSPNPNTASPVLQDSCKCLLCKRSYSTQTRLRKHMRLVHKILAGQSAASSSSTDKKPQSGEGAGTKDAQGLLKRPREDDKNENSPVVHKPKLSVGFDFKQLFCKLCKRQFSSRQNLAKHIELHTDNCGDIFIKFYRCPMCRYESRRKRDVLRHISVVHKKNSAYLAKILPILESRAVKKSAESVLSSSVQSGDSKDSNGHRKADTATSPSPQEASPKQDVRTPSPPVTRRQSLSLHASSVTCSQITNGTASGEETRDGSEVRVTKNFSLHACDVCGRAFAKKLYLESHKRSHRNAAKSDGRTVGVSTRSRSLLCCDKSQKKTIGPTRPRSGAVLWDVLSGCNRSGSVSDELHQGEKASNALCDVQEAASVALTSEDV